MLNKIQKGKAKLQVYITNSNILNVHMNYDITFQVTNSKMLNVYVTLISQFEKNFRQIFIHSADVQKCINSSNIISLLFNKPETIY